MSKLQINLHQDFQPAGLPQRNSKVLRRSPLSSQLYLLVSTFGCLAGLLLTYLLF